MCLILKEEAALLFVLRSILSVDGKPPFKTTADQGHPL